MHGCMYLGLVWIGCFDIYRVSKFTAPKLILLKERKLKIEGAKQVLKHKRESTVRSQQVVERLKSLRSELIAIMEELEKLGC